MTVASPQRQPTQTPIAIRETRVDRAGVPVGRRVWLVMSGVFAAGLGLLPHVLHHAGPLAGAALLAGAGGSLLFGALGFVAAIPLLLRMRRRFGSWRAPMAALCAFVALFALSTFAIGPAITGEDSSTKRVPTKQVLPQPQDTSAHEAHH